MPPAPTMVSPSRQATRVTASPARALRAERGERARPAAKVDSDGISAVLHRRVAPHHGHLVEVGADAQALEHVLGQAPRSGHEAVEQREGPGPAGGQVVEHRHHAGDAGRPRLPGHEGRPDRLGRQHQVAVAVGEHGRVVAVAAEDRRHGRQVALAAQAGVLAHRPREPLEVGRRSPPHATNGP